MQAKAVVEAGGGLLLSQPPSSLAPWAVRLLGRTEISLRREEDMFLVKYVTDCARENTLLDNLADYRIR